MTCLRYNRNNYDAEDCLQTSMVNIFSNLHQFDVNKGSFNTWSTRIVINTNIQYLKSKESMFSMEYLDSSETLYDSAVESNESYQLNSEKLKDLIQKLPTGYRTVFNLFVIEGYDHTEIAEILNIKIGTSKSQLAKAKLFLRNKIEEVLKTATT